MQPAPLDGGRQGEDIVARLSRVFEPEPGKTDVNFAIGAIAEIQPTVKARNVISGLGAIQGVEDNVRLGQQVFVVGRTTGIGKATVSKVAVIAKIAYVSGTITFGNLIELRGEAGGSPTKGGDSGAPVLTENGKLVGMIFAGSSETSYALPIRRLFDELGVELY